MPAGQSVDPVSDHDADGNEHDDDNDDDGVDAAAAAVDDADDDADDAGAAAGSGNGADTHGNAAADAATELGRDAMPADLELPMSNIVRIVKDHLPTGCSITKDAKAAFSKATSLFIMYLTATYVDWPLRTDCVAPFAGVCGTAGCAGVLLSARGWQLSVNGNVAA